MIKKIMVFVIFILFIIISLFSGCVEDYGCVKAPLRIKSIHEWGIFEHSYNNTTIYFGGPNPNNFSRPPVVKICEDKPVIYFHGRGQGNISITIKSNATDIVTIPEAELLENKFTWDINLWTNKSNRNLLNPVDCNDRAYDYLFYEGKDFRNQDILANITINETVVKFNITNICDSIITNLYFWYHSGNNNTDINLVYIPSLQPNENYYIINNKNKTVNKNYIRNKLKSMIIKNSLTIDEAEDLLNYWVDGEIDSLGKKNDLTWFQNRNEEYSQIIYFIDQSEYDELLPIKIDKNIDEIIRVGIVSVLNIPILKSY